MVETGVEGVVEAVKECAFRISEYIPLSEHCHYDEFFHPESL